MKSILLPTDFSDNSINAIHYAVELFKNERCEFFFLNVQKASSFVSDDLMSMQPSTTIYQNLIDSSKKAIDRIISEIKAKFNCKNHLYHTIVDYDLFIDAINQIITSKNIDLIVMGTQGASSTEKVLFGSNTTHIMQNISCPVLAIPNNYKYRPIKNIVFTSNYHTKYKQEEIKPLLELAESNQAKIHVIHLAKGEQLSSSQINNMAFLDEFFTDLNHEFVNIESKELFKTVEKYTRIHDIDVLAMMSRKHSFFERLFTRHTVETFAFNVNIPFLVMENTGELME